MISIIVPVYNGEETIVRCLKSLLCQTYDDYEIVIVDDGSTDSTIDCITSLKSEKIRLFAISNSGPSAARNFGLLHCNPASEYVMFVDSDDSVQPEFIETLSRFASETSLSVCAINHRYENTDINTVSGNDYSEISDIWNSQRFYDLLKIGIISPLWNKCYSLKVIRDNNLQIPANLPEDIIFNIKYLSIINKLVFIDKPLYNYIHRPGSVSCKACESLFQEYIGLQIQLLNRVKRIYHNVLLEFFYPQYLATTLAFIRKKDYTVPFKYIKAKEVRQAINAHRPSSMDDAIMKYLFKYKFFGLMRRL